MISYLNNIVPVTEQNVPILNNKIRIVSKISFSDKFFYLSGRLRNVKDTEAQK